MSAEGDRPKGDVQRGNLLGIGLALAATMVFACLDTITKQLVMVHDVPLVAAIRYAIQLVLIVAIFGPRQRGALIRAQSPILALLRGLCLAASAGFMSLALQRMPVAETTAIIYAAPLLVLLLSGPFLSERVGRLAWISAAGGFIGVLLVARPGSGLDPLGLLFASANVLTTAIYYLLSRRLSQAEGTTVLLLYAAIAGLAVFAPTLPWFWFDAAPSPDDAIRLVAVGILALLGHGLLTAANRFVAAALLATVSYTQIIWAALLGWLVFDQRPDALAWAGIALLLLSGLVASLYRR